MAAPESLPGPAFADTPMGAWRRRLPRRPWLALAGGLMTLVAVLTLTLPMPRLDRLLQDSPHAVFAPPPSQDIVIVAIDDASLAAVGRWPWRRALHAELLRRIAAQSPACIAIDLLMTEPDSEHPGDDAVLARAIADSGCVVLPMALQRTGPQAWQELLPLPELAAASSGVGHAHLSLDHDGVARSVYLHEGFPGRRWPHLALAVLEAGAPSAPRRTEGPPTQAAPASTEVSSDAGPWQRADHRVITFTTDTARYRTYSYIDVLRGRVPPDAFRDRYVLIGTTAAGLGDQHVTPESDAHGLMPGVDIFASVLQDLLTGRGVVMAEPWQDLLFNLGPLAIALVGLLWLQPLGIIALVSAMLALQFGIHLARPLIGLQFAPAAGFAGLLLVYPLWSLTRLSAAVRYLREETEELSRDVDGRPSRPPTRHMGDFLDRQMATTWAAARRMQDVHRFVREGMDHLPDATMTLSTGGCVILSNRAAQRHWERSAADLLGQDAHALMADLRWRSNGTPMLPRGALLDSLEPVIGEGEDAQGRILLLRCVPFFNARNDHAGWMVALVDITAMRHAQSQRDEALRFISHDAREPSAAILTIVELARARPGLYTEAALLDRIERHARTGLELADGFVNLARAEAQSFRAELLDLVSLVQQAIDDAWARARKGTVQVRLVAAPDEALCIADRGLLARALSNVLSNALKYSPPGAELHCSVTSAPRAWRVAMQDFGPGIPVELQSQLFQPFHRLHHDAHPEVHGVGLGLLLVRTVVQRHGGSIEIDSAAGAGCTVTLVLPAPTAAELAALWPAKEQ